MFGPVESPPPTQNPSRLSQKKRPVSEEFTYVPETPPQPTEIMEINQPNRRELRIRFDSEYVLFITTGSSCPVTHSLVKKSEFTEKEIEFIRKHSLIDSTVNFTPEEYPVYDVIHAKYKDHGFPFLNQCETGSGYRIALVLHHHME